MSNRINPVVKAKWLKALRSNKFKQGKHWLRQRGEEGEVSYCCLGVLCELYDEETKANGFIPSPTCIGMGDTYLGDAKVLPLDVMKWAGLSSKDGGTIPKGNDTYTCLPLLNDTGKTFREIADVIEKEFNGTE